MTQKQVKSAKQLPAVHVRLSLRYIESLVTEKMEIRVDQPSLYTFERCLPSVVSAYTCI